MADINTNTQTVIENLKKLNSAIATTVSNLDKLFAQDKKPAIAEKFSIETQQLRKLSNEVNSNVQLIIQKRQELANELRKLNASAQNGADVQTKIDGLKETIKSLKQNLDFGNNEKVFDRLIEDLNRLDKQNRRLISFKQNTAAMIEQERAMDDLSRKVIEAEQSLGTLRENLAALEKQKRDSIELGLDETALAALDLQVAEVNTQITEKEKVLNDASVNLHMEALKNKTKATEEFGKEQAKILAKIEKAAAEAYAKIFSHIGDLYKNELARAKEQLKEEQMLSDHRLANFKRQNEARIMAGQVDEELHEKTKEYLKETIGLDDEATLAQITNAEAIKMLEHANQADKEEREQKTLQLEKEAARKQNELDKVKAWSDYGIAVADLSMELAKFIATYMGQTGIFGLSAPVLGPLLFAPLFGMLTANHAMKLNALNARFAQGGEVNKDMFAWVGDAFKHEYGVTKEGTIFKTPNTPTLTPLNEGTVIYKDLATFLSEFINPRVNEEITSFGNVTYYSQFKELNKGVRQIERNTRFAQRQRMKYHEPI